MNFPAAQLVQIPFRTVALDESADPKQAPPGVLSRLDNGVWLKDGRIEKRPGTKAFPTDILGGGNITQSLEKVWLRDRELAATDGDAIYSWLPSQEKWKRMHSIRAIEATWKTAVDSMSDVNHFDVDATAEYVAMCWLQFGAGNVGLRVLDREGGDLFCASDVGSGHGRVLIKGTSVILIDSSGADIRARALDLTTGVVGAPTTLRNDAAFGNGESWDVCHNGADFTLAYMTNGGAVRIYRYNTAFVQQATALVVNNPNAKRCAVHATPGENVYVVYSADGPFDVFLAVHDPTTLVQTVAPILAFNGAPPETITHVSVFRYDAGSCIVAFSNHFTDDDAKTYTYRVSSLGVVQPGNQRTRWAQLASKPFLFDGRFYAFFLSTRPAIQVAGGSFTQNTTFVSQIEFPATVVANAPHKLVAVIAPREGPALDTVFNPWTPCSVPVVGVNAYAIARCARTGPVGSISAGRSGAYLVTLTQDLTDPWKSVEVGRTLGIAGGAFSTYDGQRFFEVGFLHAPRVLSVTPGAGGQMAGGDYLYSFVYEWRDAAGLLYRSAPSQPVKVTVGAAGNVAIDVEAVVSTCKADFETGFGGSFPYTCRIVPYRSTVGGTTLYRHPSEFLNDPIAGNAGLFDSLDDNDLSGVGLGPPLNTRPLLYTTGGILDEVIPPAFTTCILHRGRVYGVAGDLRTIWPSKVFTEDPGVFPGFHENLRIVIDEDVVGLASLDDKLVIFSESSIWVVVGDGPNAAGDGAFSVPEQVQSDVGAITAKSIVEVPDGVMFLSSRGIYLLTRQLEVAWIGKAVRDRISEYPTLLDARLVPHRSQVRFSLFAPADGIQGITVVYDYVNRFWSTFYYWDTDQAGGRTNSSVVHGGVLYMTSNKYLAHEDDEANLDHESEWVTLDIELTLIPSGPIAWQHIRRVQLLGERITNHDLRLRFAFDHKEDYAQDFTFTAAMVEVNNDCPTVRVGSQNGANPKCRAIRIRASDASPTPLVDFPVEEGKGGWFSGIGLELIPKPGLPRHGARNSKV